MEGEINSLVEIEAQSFASLPIDQLNEQVADPKIFCGGGSVAAVTASGAAALTLLVLELTAPRRSNAHLRDGILQSIEKTREIQTRLYAAADEDVAALNALLEAQRQVRKSPDRSIYIEALANAAVSPMDIGRASVELLEIIDSHLDHATRFTMSDLGAAAALARGAVQAALLTTDVNIVLLQEEAGADDERAATLASEMAAILKSTDTLASRIVERTIAVIHKSSEGSTQ